MPIRLPSAARCDGGVAYTRLFGLLPIGYSFDLVAALGQFFFGGKPVLDVVSVFTAAFEVEFVGSSFDLLVAWDFAHGSPPLG